ncbi:hypothetical protein [Sphingobacterium paludis]|jgi:periplasmic protein CpxP/Spy|uniref:Spy/CpxP family protein refolding chaperone n=1 Tax=Sphingobacterium paludis TaxID=1476465 RepID=A0A4R7D6L6_9SPHI|nr:hypothetical protein [Sphingobacterium paludis]TDS16227.1 hypothetical protein B0I21_102554 [Sphingobacterium paludis]
MKKILSLAILFSGISLATFAQEQQSTERPVRKERKHIRHQRSFENRNPEEIAKLKTERLDKELKFTDKQRNEVYSIQLEQAKRQVEHRAAMKEMQEKWRETSKGMHQEMASVLTAEQQELLKEKVEEGKKSRVMRKPGGFKGKSKTDVTPQRDSHVAG